MPIPSEVQNTIQICCRCTGSHSKQFLKIWQNLLLFRSSRSRFFSRCSKATARSLALKSHIIWQPWKVLYNLATPISKIAFRKAITIYFEYISSEEHLSQYPKPKIHSPAQPHSVLDVVYFDQLSGPAITRKLVETLLIGPFSTFFVHFKHF